jgi:hypothetical protein
MKPKQKEKETEHFIYYIRKKLSSFNEDDVLQFNTIIAVMKILFFDISFIQL